MGAMLKNITHFQKWKTRSIDRNIFSTFKKFPRSARLGATLRKLSISKVENMFIWVGKCFNIFKKIRPARAWGRRWENCPPSNEHTRIRSHGRKHFQYQHVLYTKTNLLKKRVGMTTWYFPFLTWVSIFRLENFILWSFGRDALPFICDLLSALSGKINMPRTLPKKGIDVERSIGAEIFENCR